ncbi:hypothetical protein EJ08DRAFT_600096 [Tothia fuscella]|uniref:Meiotically up-regulated protein Msb1/Mug8 domain-containing protein n=1 Tax=Tothia fuscella TaxID=1048955 RepID=A0A9P4NEG7_9PEZI|nr:hypothetical protein EJ08DRAFT_600096 [Tothia fuscella]
MPFFSNIFKRDGASKARKNADASHQVAPPKLKWEEAWSRKDVTPEEVYELIHECTQEMKSRALDMPFLLLPFRPGADSVGSKSFIRNFFRVQYENTWHENKHVIEQELRLLDPMVLCSIMKWCWSRLPGGVVSWETYDLFRVGEIDSKMAKNAFTVFIPMSSESDARKRIIFDFFDLLAAIAARGKTNGLGGRKLSRMAGWWAFEHSDGGKGFDGGYRSWANSADATSHLFFAYLRSLSPEATGGVSGISQLPRSLQALLSQTEYPPETPTLMLIPTTKVVMIVNSVSPTPFALLRRARNFEYRDDDEALQRFSSYEDPVKTLTEECRRVLNAISSTNQSVIPSQGSTGGAVPEGTWSRFEDMGFSNIDASLQSPGDLATTQNPNGLRNRATSQVDDLGRPTTPSWADFLSTGFPNDRAPGLLPPDKSLPLPLQEARGHSSQSHVRAGAQDHDLEPGELASINNFDLDETFWWVWMTSLAGEETPERKAVFGRCALIETQIQGARWLVMEEQIKGASPGQEEGVYIAEKKSRFSWTKRGRMSRKKTIKKPANRRLAEEPYNRDTNGTPASKIGPEQHAKIQAAAQQLARGDGPADSGVDGQRRSRNQENAASKTTSMLTLQPAIVSEAAPAMKWAKDFDKAAIRGQYLGNPYAGTGRSQDDLTASTSNVNLASYVNGGSSRHELSNRDLPSLPTEAKVGPSPPATPPHQSSHEATPESLIIANLDEKPRVESPSQHPAMRTIVSSKTPSPEADKKQKKEISASSSGGLKKLFGRKRVSQPAPVEKAPIEKTLAATVAARKSQSPTKLHKPPPKHTPISIAQYKEPTPEPSIANSSPAHSFKGQHGISPYEHDYAPRAQDLQQEGSVIGSREQIAADAEFSRFDQGPLDAPAFIPNEITPDHSVAATSPSLQQSTQFDRTAAPPQPQSADNESDDSFDAEPAPAPVALASDRWAQIRKNAAERAARMNEENNNRSRSQSGTKTDDGETSGEETIESRVARIKARVAELTGTARNNLDPVHHADQTIGNMETPAAAGAVRR